MATQRTNRSRRGPSRNRRPSFVAPVLDPTWRSVYSASPEERASNTGAVGRFLRQRSTPVAGLVLVGVALFFVPSVGAVVGAVVLVIALVTLGLFYRRGRRAQQSATQLGQELVARFSPGGSSADRARLITMVERLAASFGLDEVSCFIVRDAVPNAALLQSDRAYVLLVTDALVGSFELIELEGVVAHLMARERLGLLDRRTMAVTLVGVSDATRRTLAGTGQAYRADEVAAALIRYPIGLAQALAKMAEVSVPTDSYFASREFNRERWVWFDSHVDGQACTDGDVDVADVRSRALVEW